MIDRSSFVRCTATAALILLATVGTAAAAPEKLKPVTMVLEWTGFQPHLLGYWLAKERGWYSDEGLDVTIRSSSGSEQAMQIVAGGQAEFGDVASSALVTAAGKSNLPLRMVAIEAQSDSLSIGYFESTGIKTPKDLEGKKVGIAPGSMAYILWDSFAKAAGVDASKVELKNWDFRSFYGIWGAKQVDASANFTLGSTGEYLFKKKGEIVRQFVFSDYLPLVGTGIFVRTDSITRDPDTIRRFVRASQKAWTFLKDQPKVAVPEASEIVAKQFDEMPPPEVLSQYAYEVIPARMSSPSTKGKPIGWSNPDDWAKMIAFLKQYDTSMTQAPAVADLMTNEFVEK